jgi:broad-specificity NMP kinase
MKTTQHIILLRGLPGAGKTSFAELIANNNSYPYYSVDDYFTDEKGNYKFEFSENHKAYAACLLNTEKALIDGFSKVIVHNTFTMDWELAPYFKLAKKFETSLFVLTVENYHGEKNLHEVSQDQLKKMAEKYQVKLF